VFFPLDFLLACLLAYLLTLEIEGTEYDLPLILGPEVCNKSVVIWQFVAVSMLVQWSLGDGNAAPLNAEDPATLVIRSLISPPCILRHHCQIPLVSCCHSGRELRVIIILETWQVKLGKGD